MRLMEAKKVEFDSRNAISSLPDEILAQIISLLPTKRAATTSILSKRWRNLFPLVCSLYASQHHFDFNDLDTLCKEKRKDVPESFKDFVDKTISGSTSIKKLSLKCLFGLIGYELTDQWILNALDRGVEDLDVRLRTNSVCKKSSRQLSILKKACVVISFPPSVFMNKTLVKLTIGINVAHVRFEFKKASLPVLKSLFLHSVWFHNEAMWRTLLPGSPILEELSIHHLPGQVYHGYLYSSREFVMTHKTLKRLTFHYSKSVLMSGFTTIFNIPSVVYLDFSGLGPFRYSKMKFEDSLIEAKLDVDIKDKYDLTTLSIIHWVRNVRTLSLSSSSVKAMCSHGEEILFFLNLRKLYFESNTEQGWEVLPRLLNKSPKLETLVLKDLHYVGNQEAYIDDKNEVKVVEIYGFRGSDRELTQVKCYLLQMQYLEVMKYEIDDDNKEPELINQLLALPKNVSKCKIQFL